MKKGSQFDARIVVGCSPKPQSAIYRIWSNKGKSDVYASIRDIAGVFKVSLHESGVCQAGFTQKFEIENKEIIDDVGGSRHQSRWCRKTHVGPRIITPLQFCIPANQLKVWEKKKEIPKKTTWIDPPEKEYSIIISCIFSGQVISDDNWPGRVNGTKFIGTKVLPNGEKFWLIWQKCQTSQIEYNILTEAAGHMRREKMIPLSGVDSKNVPTLRMMIFKEFFDLQLLIGFDVDYKSLEQNEKFGD